ncbi:disease resistance protein RPV1 isoform X2 [Lactuca sativa]|uniref:disease resistance protein RPV1 isoform X2 n=1 Tax=Lactuca sativa TaxID=4236 RepID=UPI000CD8FBFF|nr:disease resistance protein RPV1 isoform X2 [Lactuca sativa]
MHQLVQEMGRFEVLQESLDKPWKRSRLWCHEESFKVSKKEKGKGNILGLALDMRMVEKEKSGASFELDTLSNMDNLMLLQLNYVHMNGSYENFPEELRCLCMHGNPQRHEKRQKLSGSCLKQKRVLGSLKILNLSFCKQLRSLGDFDQLPALERLIVRNCIGLNEVCESIGQCVKLVLIDLSYCNKLEKIQKITSMLANVKIMFLEGCNLGESRIKIRDIDLQERLKANDIDVNTITSSSAFGGAIPSDLKFSAFSLPRSLVSSLHFSCLSMLKHLYLDGNLIDSMPICVRTLPRLEILSMTVQKKCQLVTKTIWSLTIECIVTK